MSKINIVGNDLLKNTEILNLRLAFEQTVDILAVFAKSNLFEQSIIEVFGSEVGTHKLLKIRQHLFRIA